MRASMTRVMLLGMLVAAVDGLSGGGAEACSCVGPRPACAVVWQTTAVFRGRVVAIASVPHPDPPAISPPGFSHPGGLLVTFDRHDTLHGELSGGRVDIFTELQSSACGYTFKPGSEYIVYAYGGRDGRPLTTNSCSRTKLLDEAGEDVAYLRALRTEPGKLRTRISGRLTFGDQDLDTSAVHEFPPPPRVPVVLTPQGDAPPPPLRTEMLDDGTFTFDGIPAGRYHVTLDLPDTLKSGGGGRPFEVNIPTPQACADASFFISHNGRIAGRVLDGAGAGVAGAAVGVASQAGVHARWTRVLETSSASDGSFELRGVPPGRYLLGINMQRAVARNRTPPPRVFYPGTTDASAARVFELGAGERLIVGTFTLPAGITGTAPPP